MKHLFFIAVLGVATFSASAVDYLRDIKPELKERCYASHWALKQKAGLRVDSAANLRKEFKIPDSSATKDMNMR